MTTQKALPNDLIDSLLAHYKKPEALIGENGLTGATHQSACRTRTPGRDV